MKFNTSLLHGAFRGEPQTGATLTPIYQSSAFEQESAERLEKIFHNQAPGFTIRGSIIRRWKHLRKG